MIESDKGNNGYSMKFSSMNFTVGTATNSPTEEDALKADLPSQNLTHCSTVIRMERLTISTTIRKTR